MPDILAPIPLDDDVNPEALLHTLLAISLTGVMLLRPVYAADSSQQVEGEHHYSRGDGAKVGAARQKEQ